MRWMVVGHSGTVGSAAVEGVPWPKLLADYLVEASGDRVEVDSFPFWPAGPKAAGFALGRIDEAAPDGVILDLNAFPSAVTSVSESVKQRFGVRAGRAYARAERVARQGEQHGRRPAEWRWFARRIARAVLGAAPRCDIEDSSRVFSEVLRGLVQREHLETVILSDSSFGPRIRKLQPGIGERIARLQAPARALASEHRIPWVDAGRFVANDTEDGWAADNIHLNAQGNEAYARGLAAAILALRAAGEG